ncbi:hypothetical protein, partial [Bartonella sp. DB5-6]|uniref:hypothetical protein n=1 Tax=Bartonella sp. DB5-6 TaxID=1094755 RepID=UPI000590A61D
MIHVVKGYRTLFIFIAAAVFSLPIVNINANSRNSCNDEAGFYRCSDGEKHTIKDKTYNLKSFQGDSSLSAPIAAIYVEKKGTVVE